MDNYFDGTGTIGFTCDNCGRQLQGCTWVNGMKLCAKCYQETFGNNNMTENLKNMYDAYSKVIAEKDQTISDLEAKLAGLQQEKIEYTDTINFVETSEPDRVAKELDRLNQQLAESEKSKEYFADRVEKADKEIKENYRNYNKLVEEYNQLKQQLAEKEKEIERLTEINLDIPIKQMQFHHNQDKISFAVAYLELLKAFIIDKEFYFVGEDYSTVYVEDITEEINNQIKQLKEME